MLSAMRALLLPLLFCFAASVWGAETGYRLVHPDGTVEFSDQPIPGGEEILLREAPTIQFTPPPPSSTPAAVVRGQGAAKSAPGDGSPSIRITSPQSGQTLWYDGSGVTVAVVITPALQKGQMVVISMDGRQVASGNGNSFHIAEVYRGSHTLTAVVVDVAGATLVSSSPVTIHMRQHSQLERQDKEPAVESGPEPLLPE